jgi:hypothetical protein
LIEIDSLIGDASLFLAGDAVLAMIRNRREANGFSNCSMERVDCLGPDNLYRIPTVAVMRLSAVRVPCSRVSSPYARMPASAPTSCVL